MDRATEFPDADVAERDGMDTLTEPLDAADTAEVPTVPRPDAVPAAVSADVRTRAWLRLDRIGYAVAAVAAIAAATPYAMDRVTKHRAGQAAERKAEAEQRRARAEEARKIESLKATIDWDYKRAKRAVEAWQAHKDGRNVMDRQTLEACLRTMQIWLEKAEALHAYERNGGRPSNEAMYYYLSMPEVQPSADELRRTLQPVAADR